MSDTTPMRIDSVSRIPWVRLNDGRSAPQLGLGVWQIPDDEVTGVVLSALAAGYRLIDTATIYGNERGLGAAIRQSGLPRESLFITTKLWNDSHGRDATLRAFERSLEQLGVDYLDLYLIHWPVPAAGRYLESWSAMARLVQEGRVRSIGVSNFNPPHLKRLIDETGIVPVVNQIELHPTFQQRMVTAFNSRHHIVTQSWSPLGQGKLLEHPVIRSIATRHARTPAQVILRWHLENGYMVIPKSVRRDRLIENAAVFDFSLDAADRQAIEALDNPGGRLGGDPELET